MRYTTTVIIEKPIDQVITLFDDMENYPLWMEGLENYRMVSGNFGEEGSRSNMEFKLKNRHFVMEEEVLKRNLPGEYTVKYLTKGINNIVKNRFVALGNNTTQYQTENIFELGGLLKLLSPLMKGGFKKQSLKYQNDFKQFAEDQPQQ